VSKSASEPPREGILAARQLRRASQAAFLVLFFASFFLLVGAGPAIPGLELDIFFDLNPLAAVSTLFSSGHIYGGMIWSLGIVALTVVMGRAFCGWLCPMGTLQHVVGRLRRWKASLVIRRNRSGPHQKVKYAVLAFSLAAALMGSALSGLLDPIAFLVRGMAEGFMPAFAGLLEALASLLALVPVYPFTQAPTGVSHLLGVELGLAPEGLVSTAALFTLLVFAAALAAAAWMPRFYCRVLCPLGAMLGLLGRFSLFGLDRDEEACTHCGKCSQSCEGGCDPEPGSGRRWKPHECVLCLNCQASCPDDALRFRFFPGDRHAALDPGRRSMLASAAAGLAFVPVSRSGIPGERRPHPRRVRPPGSLPEDEFLARCLRCGTCMKACPTNVIQPAVAEASLEGIYTPVLVPAAGYCEVPCVRCSEVCPSGAIAPLTKEQKGWESPSPSVIVGTAIFDRGACLPWANRTPCIVCQEHCPTAPKAIVLEEVEEVGFDGSKIRLQRPHLDPSMCMGCGACEFVCPVVSRPAVRVIAWNESREGGSDPRKLSM
jgi:polyferredoxin